MKKFLLIFVALLAVACSDSTGPAPRVTGNWSGTVGSASLTLQLTQTDAAVSGTGAFSGPGGSAAMTATGSYIKPTVSMTLSSPGFEPINITGTLNGDALNGTANGSGFINSAVTLTRN